MSLTITPFFDTSFERQLDRDLVSIARLFEPSCNQPRAPRETVQHRHPNYLFEENDQQANLQVELPGVRKEHVSLDIQANTLVITGKRFRSTSEQTARKEAENPDEDMKSDENKEQPKAEEPKPIVAYKLKLRIPRRYDAENITAAMEGNGILNIVIPVTKEKANRTITIQ